MRAAHITQLRTAINKLRAATGLVEYAFPALTAVMKVEDMTTLRDAIGPALTTIGAPPLSSHFFAEGHMVERWHLQEIRERLE